LPGIHSSEDEGEGGCKIESENLLLSNTFKTFREKSYDENAIGIASGNIFQFAVCTKSQHPVHHC
jgi:hypothetical protein